MKLILHRMADVGGSHTFGRIEDEERNHVCFTLEEPWRDANGDGIGDRSVSRIPPGTYTCRRDLHGKSKPNPYEVWEVCGVPGRSEIHIHRGNTTDHTEGCILVGTGMGKVAGKPAVLDSKTAFDALMKLTAGLKETTLEVRDVTHPVCEEKP